MPKRHMSDGEDIGVIIVGAITNASKDQNVALVKESKTGHVKAVKQGFDVLDYKVAEVTAKYIILVKANEERLVFQNKFAGEFMGPGATSTPVGFSSQNENYAEDGLERRGNKITVSADLRDKLVNEDLSKVLMQATAIPKIENGEIIGFRILQIDAGSIYDKAGLQDNDIVTSINGMRLNSVAGAVRLLKSLKGSSDVSLDINRNGASMTLQLNVAH